VIENVPSIRDEQIAEGMFRTRKMAKFTMAQQSTNVGKRLRNQPLVNVYDLRMHVHV
jgi:hypothetical protein